jgi:DNA-binding NtrC family response regulator
MENIKNLNIFIVDDDVFCAELYKEHLLNTGYTNVTNYNNGQDCINNLTEQPNIIFLDYHMMPLDGLEVLKKIKRFNPDIYLVVLSGQEDMQVAINALKYGAFDYIIKGDKDLDMIQAVLHKIKNVMEIVEKKSVKPWFIPKRILSLY